MNRGMTGIKGVVLLALIGIIGLAGPATGGNYPIVDTGQQQCYDDAVAIAAPAEGQAFHGQDAQYDGNQPDYTVSGDGLTVLDNVTGLVWQRRPDTDLDGDLEPDDKLSWWDAMSQPGVLNAISYGGYDDWRLPDIKTLYSLIVFSGVDPSGYTGGTSGLIPFIDTTAFEFIYGDESSGERIIDSQYWSSTEYVSTTMGGDHTVFGVNFADGRIKGYGTSLHGSDKTAFVLCVRGDATYGVNDFVDNGDGTVTDRATDLMWMQEDSGTAMNWQDALAYAEGLSYAGHDDWRLPDAKELQSILDYNRSPDTHGTAAIDPLFSCTAITDEGGGTNWPFYWTGTTHSNWTVTPGSAAAYVAFGEALGWMQDPFPPFAYTLMDVHGAGSQRSDPKDGDPADYPYGHGPQGDVIRIFNYVRCVRDASTTTGVEEGSFGTDADEVPDLPDRINLMAAPNPFNPATEISFSLPDAGQVTLVVYNGRGSHVCTLFQGPLPKGEHRILWHGVNGSGQRVPSGMYFARLSSANAVRVAKLILAK